MATLLGCAQKDLHQRQYAEMHPALRAVGEIWNIMFGARFGEDVGRNMVSVLDCWAHGDTAFKHWNTFAPKDQRSPWALVKRILTARIEEWAETYWEFLRSGKAAPAATLADFLDQKVMRRDDDEYREMYRAAKRLQRGAAPSDLQEDVDRQPPRGSRRGGKGRGGRDGGGGRGRDVRGENTPRSDRSKRECNGSKSH